MKLLLIILFVVSILNVTVDWQLTEYALDNGYYETNQFTNDTSPLTHFVVLVLLLSLFLAIALHFKELILVSVVLLGTFAVVWTINNVYSVMII